MMPIFTATHVNKRVLCLVKILICTSLTWSAEVEIGNPSGEALRKKLKKQVSIDTSNPKNHLEVGKQKTPHEKLIENFIAEGVKKNPLPLQADVESELLSSRLIKDIDKVIVSAFKGDPSSMQIMGGVYLMCWETEKALSFLLRSAEKSNAGAFWVLSSMCRNKHIENFLPGLDKALLDKADELGSNDAKLYKKESEAR